MSAAAVEPLDADEAEVREIRRAQQAHKRAEREAALGLPPRPLSRDRQRPEDDLGWHDLAVCRDPEPDDRDVFTEARSQQDAADVVAVYCLGARPCPVRERCLAMGRNTHGSGIYGGHVLVYGHLAPETPPKRRRAPRLATVPTTGQDETEEAMPAAVEGDVEEPGTEEPTATEQHEVEQTPRPGQRWQPRRARSRSQRKGRR